MVSLVHVLRARPISNPACTSTSLSLTYGTWVGTRSNNEMSLERSLQGRKLERDFPAGYSRNRGLGQACKIISVGEIPRDFLSLNQRSKKIVGPLA